MSMNFVVKEFERDYAYGEKLPYVRAFVNKYFIQGGEHARNQILNKTELEQERQKRMIDEKLTLLEYLLN